MKKILALSVLVLLSACGDDNKNQPPFQSNTFNPAPEIDETTGCPKGMPAYKCEQIKNQNNDSVPAPVVIKD